MKLIQSKSKKWEAKPGGYSKKIFLDEEDLNYPGALVQELKIKPGDICANHYHKKQTEIFYFTTVNGEVFDSLQLTFSAKIKGSPKIAFTDGEIEDAKWMRPAEAKKVLHERGRKRLDKALDAIESGKFDYYEMV